MIYFKKDSNISCKNTIVYLPISDEFENEFNLNYA